MSKTKKGATLPHGCWQVLAEEGSHSALLWVKGGSATAGPITANNPHDLVTPEAHGGPYKGAHVDELPN